MSKLRVLDVGSGSSEVSMRLWGEDEAEVVRVDLNPETEPDVVADVQAIPDEVGLGTFDVVFASHILEHVARLEVVDTLRHWAGFLKPGGAMHILVPDLVWAAEQVVSGHIPVAVMLHIYGSQQSPLQMHKVGFSIALLRAAVAQAGLQVYSAVVGPYQLNLRMTHTGDQTVEARQIYIAAVKPQEAQAC